MNHRRDAESGDSPRSPRLREFLLRRLSELGAIALAAASAAVFLSIISFDPADPSWNAAVPRTPANWLGHAGAWMADLILQFTGLSGLLLGVIFGGWAWRLGTHQGLGRVWLRLIMLPPAIFLTGISLASLIPPHGWPMGSGMGGIIGDLLFDNIYAAINPLIGTRPIWFGLFIAVPAFVAWMMAMGLSIADWHQFGQAGLWIWDRIARGGGYLVRLAAAVWRRRASDSPGEPVAARAKPGRRRAGNPAPARHSGDLVADRKARSAAGRRADAARQRELDFGPSGTYTLPPLDLLNPFDAGATAPEIDRDALEQNARLLESVLDDFGVHGSIVKVRPGPVVTLYELEPAPGTKSSRVVGLSDDIARSMSALSVRVAVIPGRNVIGIELPNRSRELVSLRELMASKDFERAAGQLTLTLGKDISGAPVLVDLSRMPHLLIAGTTGSGKSVAINTMILSMLYRLSPEECRFIMIDPKMLELSVYDGIPHLMSPVVTDPAKAVVALRWAVREMERRYRDMSVLGVRNLAGYNARIAEAQKRGEQLTRTVPSGRDAETGQTTYETEELELEPLPLVVVIVDEMADLMLVAGKEVEMAVQRLAQMARAAGIHLIMATQRPSVDVITGTIKANFPTRVSFQVTSKIDSRTILGEAGAEQLLGQGDMLYMAGGGRITRVHGPFVSDEEVERVVGHLRTQGEPRYVDEVTEDIDPAEFSGPDTNGGGEGDALYDQAVALVCRERKASTSFVQRHLQIGYNRAARIIERMEHEGVISQANHVGRREVLARDIDSRVS